MNISPFIFIGLAIIIYLYFKLKSNSIYDEDFIRKHAKPFFEIENNGFKIHRPGNPESSVFLWNDIVSADLKDNKQLIFYLNNGQHITFSRKEFPQSWEVLLLSIPTKLQNEKIKQLAKEIKSHLTTCPICGKIAVLNGSCLYCGAEPEDYKKDFEYQELKTEAEKQKFYQAYLKEEQTFWFAPENPLDEINFYLKDSLFDIDPHWKPVVTKEELRKWSEEN